MKWVKRWKVRGSGGKTYVVALSDTGEYGCDCPVWKFRRERCKHIDEVLRGGGAPYEEDVEYSEETKSFEPKKPAPKPSRRRPVPEPDDEPDPLESIRQNAKWGL